MRKLLVLLSVVLLFALCQSQEVEKEKKKLLIKPNFCPFGYKKVNGTKVCKTYKEYLKHPRNFTNCTKDSNLKCRKIENKTLCFCVPKIKVLPHRNISLCKPGEILRCKFDRNTLKRGCKCEPVLPRVKTDPSELNCPTGTTPKCKGNRCICAKIKIKEREPVFPQKNKTHPEVA